MVHGLGLAGVRSLVLSNVVVRTRGDEEDGRDRKERLWIRNYRTKKEI